MNKFQIVVDSSSDMLNDHFDNNDILFNVVPLTINVDKKEFVDNSNLNSRELLDAVYAYKGQSTSSCPSSGSFEEIFRKAENTICITLSSKLSGTYNSARLAKDVVKDDGHNVHVIDTKNTTGCILLAAERAYQLMTEGLEFGEICNEVDKLSSRLSLLFILRDFSNLIKNGRMTKVSGFIATTLKITPIATAIDGEIQVVEKKRTVQAAVKRLVEMIGEKVTDFNEREVIISHCFDNDAAELLKEMILEKYNFIKVRIKPMRGLASFYALDKGILVSF